MPRDHRERSSSRSHRPRHRSYNSPDMRQVSSDGRTLPVPNTYSEHKRGDRRGNGNGKMSRHIKPAGESGRSGFHPIHFSKISFRSTSRASLLCNFLWPFVPAAIAVRCTFHPAMSTFCQKDVLLTCVRCPARPPCYHLFFGLHCHDSMCQPDWFRWPRAFSKAASCLGCSYRDHVCLPKTLSFIMHKLISFRIGSIVEIILFMVLLSKNMFYVIKAAILGSILATMLLCLGCCFFVGGMLEDEQEFSEAISEAGSGLLLTAYVTPTLLRLPSG